MGALVRGMSPSGKVRDPAALDKALREYAVLIQPWAQQVAATMLAEVYARTGRAWTRMSKEIGQGLRVELTSAPTGAAMQELMQDQVGLITSLPTTAADRVHRLVAQAMIESTRAADIAAEIARTSDVTEARARLIARTEVARAASVLTESRAVYAGGEGYIWRTSGDGNVRDSHREMDGKYVRWDTKPRLSDGTVTHAGQIYSCRCFADPVLPNL